MGPPANNPSPYDEQLRGLVAELLKRASQKPRGSMLRVWHPECGDGRHAVALLAALESMADTRFDRRSLRCFGTDAAEHNVLAARRRSLSASSSAGVPATGSLDELIRKSCLFAVHDLERGVGFPDLDAVLWTGGNPDTMPRRYEIFADGMALGGLLLVCGDGWEQVPSALFERSALVPGLFVRRGAAGTAARPARLGLPQSEVTRRSSRFSQFSELPPKPDERGRAERAPAPLTAPPRPTLAALPCAVAFLDERLTIVFENQAFRSWHGGTDATNPRRPTLRALLEECGDVLLRGTPVFRALQVTLEEGAADYHVHLLPHASSTGVRGVSALIMNMGGVGRLPALRSPRATLRLLANVSHEVRTPLNAVIGFAEHGTCTAQSEVDRQTYARVLSAGRHALRVTADLLDFAQLELGKGRVIHAPFALAEVVQNALSFVRHGAEEKGLALTLEEADELPRVVFSDAGRLTQILTNLLANAVKFTHEGEIRLTVSASDSQLTFRVVDTGVGVSPEDLPKLFQPFEQGRPWGQRKRPAGTGLGLAISKQLVELLGGSITLENAATGGAVATLHVPCVAVSGAPHAAELPAPPAAEPSAPISAWEPHAGGGDPRRSRPSLLTGMRVLVVEDNATNRVLMTTVLSERGAEVVCAHSAEEVLERHGDCRDFDAVLCDIELDGMDGFELCERMQQYGTPTPVLAVTAHSSLETRERAEQAGMRGVLTKPVSSDRLVEALRRLGTRR